MHIPVSAGFSVPPEKTKDKKLKLGNIIRDRPRT